MNASRTIQACLVVSVLSTTACVVYDDGSSQPRLDADPYALSCAPSATPEATPMRVDVDADKTMVARGGEGVGVFVEYRTGGHWIVSWTCDSELSEQPCDFDIRASTPGGIRNVDISKTLGAGVTPRDNAIDVRSRVVFDLPVLRFDTDPGAVLRLEATVGCLRDNRLFFFVQDGKLNGGFNGPLTNPLELRGRPE